MTKISLKEELDNLLASDTSKLFILDFNAPWCGPCRTMKSLFKELKPNELNGAEIIDIDVDDALELANEYNVRTIPLILFVKNNMIIDRINGSVPKNEFLSKLKNCNDK